MFAQCVTRFGINVVVYKFAEDKPLMANMDFKTGDVVDQVGGASGAYTGSPVNGSTDGEIVQNFKNSVVVAIQDKTIELLQNGFTYGSTKYPLLLTQQPYLFSINDYIQLGGDLSITPTSVTTYSGTQYTFVDNNDYHNWFQAYFSRARAIENDNASLIDSVTAAANTQAAMDPIITSNNDRG
jgi:hypothetical protein